MKVECKSHKVSSSHSKRSKKKSVKFILIIHIHLTQYIQNVVISMLMRYFTFSFFFLLSLYNPVCCKIQCVFYTTACLSFNQSHFNCPMAAHDQWLPLFNMADLEFQYIYIQQNLHKLTLLCRFLCRLGPEKCKADHDAFSLRGRFELGPNENIIREF